MLVPDDTAQLVSPVGDSAIAVPPRPADAAGVAFAPGLSTRLYNRDLAPARRAGRRWSGYSIFTLWANDVHSLGNYGFALGLFALGLGGWQILVALGLGSALLFVLLSITGFMGYRTGVPFPVMTRIAFGVRGAQIPALLRGGVAVAWFGIQTYLASLVLRVLIIALAPGAADWDHNSILGLSTLGWIAFGSLWAVQTFLAQRGLEMIRRYEAFAGPVILVTMAALAVWVFTEAGGSSRQQRWSPSSTRPSVRSARTARRSSAWAAAAWRAWIAASPSAAACPSWMV